MAELPGTTKWRAALLGTDAVLLAVLLGVLFHTEFFPRSGYSCFVARDAIRLPRVRMPEMEEWRYDEVHCFLLWIDSEGTFLAMDGTVPSYPIEERLFMTAEFPGDRYLVVIVAWFDRDAPFAAMRRLVRACLDPEVRIRRIRVSFLPPGESEWSREDRVDLFLSLEGDRPEHETVLSARDDATMQEVVEALVASCRGHAWLEGVRIDPREPAPGEPAVTVR